MNYIYSKSLASEKRKPSLWCQVDPDRSDRIGCTLARRGVPVEFGDQQVIVLHAQRKLLHVDVVDGPV